MKQKRNEWAVCLSRKCFFWQSNRHFRFFPLFHKMGWDLLWSGMQDHSQAVFAFRVQLTLLPSNKAFNDHDQVKMWWFCKLWAWLWPNKPVISGKDTTRMFTGICLACRSFFPDRPQNICTYQSLWLQTCNNRAQVGRNWNSLKHYFVRMCWRTGKDATFGRVSSKKWS